MLEKQEPDQKSEEKHIQNSLLTTITIIVSLVLLKTVAGIITGSIGLISDGIHSITDLIVVITALIGVKIANRNASKQFPFGLHKIENMVSTGISIIIMLTGALTLLESLNRLNTRDHFIKLEFVGIIAAGASILVMLLLYNYLKIVASMTGSPTLESLATEYRMDVFVTITVLLGIISSLLGVDHVDSLAGILVSLFILVAGITIARNSLLVLLDISVDDEILGRIIDVLSRKKALIGSKSDVRATYRGRFIFLELEIEVPGNFSVLKTDLISREIIQELREAVPRIDHVSIHYKTTSSSEKRLLGIPLNEQSSISNHFGEAHFLAVVEMINGKIVDFMIEKNPFLELERGRGIKVAEWFANNKVHEIIVRSFPKGSGPIYVLKDKGIEMKILNIDLLKDLET